MRCSSLVTDALMVQVISECVGCVFSAIVSTKNFDMFASLIFNQSFPLSKNHVGIGFLLKWIYPGHARIIVDEVKHIFLSVRCANIFWTSNV